MSETTEVYFLKDSDEEEHIVSISYPGYPRFQPDDIISLEVKNHNPEKWDVEAMEIKTYQVVKVEHSAYKYYGNSVNSSTLQHVYLKESDL